MTWCVFGENVDSEGRKSEKRNCIFVLKNVINYTFPNRWQLVIHLDILCFSDIIPELKNPWLFLCKPTSKLLP